MVMFTVVSFGSINQITGSVNKDVNGHNNETDGDVGGKVYGYNNEVMDIIKGMDPSRGRISNSNVSNTTTYPQ